MGKVFSAITSIFGGGAPKAKAEPLSTKAVTSELQDDAAASKKGRAALYATQGGVGGQELSPDQVQRRPTLLGN